ncbi:hypothetical protein P692DRAFT_20543915 [Suillus brevipes Sb2]|nr:hypothetical protein P692DRAFT_20543915 [Suillus brevipes Sb2]
MNQFRLYHSSRISHAAWSEAHENSSMCSSGVGDSVTKPRHPHNICFLTDEFHMFHANE